MGFLSDFESGYSDGVGKYLWVNNMGHYFDYEGNMYSYMVIGTWTPNGKDATAANNWTPAYTPAGIFSNLWSNVPAWN